MSIATSTDRRNNIQTAANVVVAIGTVGLFIAAVFQGILFYGAWQHPKILTEPAKISTQQMPASTPVV